MSLRDHGMNRRQLRQGGGRGTGEDHVDAMFGSIELYIYQTPNSRRKGFESLKSYLEAQECEISFTADAPPELSRYSKQIEEFVCYESAEEKTRSVVSPIGEGRSACEGEPLEDVSLVLPIEERRI